MSAYPIDRDELLSRLEGDTTLLSEVAELFLDESPRRLGRAREALATADGEALALAAHSIRGSLAMLGADLAARLAWELECVARCGRLADAGALYVQLVREVAAVERAVDAFAHRVAA